jgi:hypothetical protein
MSYYLTKKNIPFMKKLILCCIFSMLSFSVSAQYEVEEFYPLPQNTEKIKGLQYTIYEGDTTSENFSEYNFDKKGNTIRWEYFTYHGKEERKYDSLNRIIEIDGLYGESFANGITHYFYPSKNQKVEIHDKMAFYRYTKSEFILDSTNRIIEEIKYDSTINLVDPDTLIVLVYKTNTHNLYDKYGNQVEELCIEDSTKEIMYEMHAVYDEKKLVNKTEKYSENHPNKSYATTRLEEYLYISNGEFKDKIENKIILEINENDTVKNEIQYSYQRVDSTTTKTDIKYFYKNNLNQFNKYLYKNNQLVKLEEYTIPYTSSQEKNQELKLSTWTEYTYFFYPEK